MAASVSAVFAAIVGVAGQLLVAVEAEHLAQDLLALRGGLHGELVRAALDEEDAVDEGLVVHVDAAVQLGLRLAGGAAGDGPEASLAIDLEEVEGAGAAARALADDAVGIAVDVEVELDAHVVGAVADAVVLDAAPRFAPQGPGDGVEEGGLAVAVLAGERGEVERGEVELAVAVREEVAEAEAAGDHGEVSAGVEAVGVPAHARGVEIDDDGDAVADIADGGGRAGVDGGGARMANVAVDIPVAEGDVLPLGALGEVGGRDAQGALRLGVLFDGVAVGDGDVPGALVATGRGARRGGARARRR